jgi:DNA polymerase III subunit delta'
MSDGVHTPPVLAPWLVPQLQALRQRKAHALLLSGAAGMGQYDLALALANSWLCENPQPHGACGECSSCHAVAVRTHADLSVLMPETVALDLDWPLPAAAQDAIEKKDRKPSRWIRVDAAREAIAFSQLTRSRSAVKVILVYPAERMNVETANTLLKTLEEPPGDLRFVLATEAAHQLLPTIRSRCQLHNMVWPAPDVVRPWLASQFPKPPAESDLDAWVLAAGGRAHAALAWGQSGLSAADWHALPKKLAAGEGGAMAQWSATEQLQTLLKLAHDLMATAAGGQPRFFAAQDLPVPPTWRGLQAWQQRLAQEASVVEHPFNPGLMLEAWLADAHATLSRKAATAARA